MAKRIFLILMIMAGYTFIYGCSSGSRAETSHATEPDHGHHHGHPADHSFADIERYAKLFESPERNRWQKPDQVVAVLKLKSGDRVADLGAGTGYFTRRFAKAVGVRGIAVGYDVEKGMVDYMKKDANETGLKNYKAVHIQNPANPKMPDKYFDVIFLCNVYHHIRNQVDYFKNIRSRLKQNGRLVIVEWKKIKTPIGPPLKYKISMSQAIEDMKKAGYRLANTHNFLEYQYFLEFKLK